jgi:prepilin-type N-terminal cleavage/methylation domain-containing protein
MCVAGTGRAEDRGFTLTEATIVLTVLAVLTAVAVPSLSRVLDRSRLTRATSDAQAIKTAISTFLGEFIPFTPFTSTGANGGDTIEMLVSDGDIPPSAIGATNWDNSVTCCAAGVDVDFLERHLVTNTPIASGSYATGPGRWRGSYIDAPLDPDPWGNRYAVNTQYLRTAMTNDVFVLSAGPDESIDTGFTMNGAVPGADDIISIVRRDSGLTVP